MATIKSFTDLEQSKKLVELGIDVNTADMWYPPSSIKYGVVNKWWEKPTIIKDFEHSVFKREYYIPCWSLAALYNILPNNEHIATSISRGGWQIQPINYLPNTWWCGYEDSESLTEFNVSAENPIDACVEMICKLHEQGLLQLKGE